MKRKLLGFGLLGLSSFLCVERVQAQAVISDGTVNTIVTRAGNVFTIDNGTTSGTNLFHSFQEFSIPTGGTALFNNAANIQNIFSRVTGGTVSNLDGIIRANGTANLFLLNPNGILFGSNARLNLGGSFIGTTAQAIKFADGTEFSAIPTASPLLTMSVPIGLQMGSNPGAIQVQGNGHTLSSLVPFFAPYAPTALPSGLRVASGKTLALVGGDLALKGGTLTAPGGRIELASIGTGQVGITPTPQGYSFNYATVPSLRSIQMTQRSLLDVSGTGAGAIQVQGNHIRLSEGSTLWNQNRGTLPAGDLTLRATGILELIGTNPNETVLSGIVGETIGTGASSNITVSAQGIVMQNGSVIQSRTFTPAPGGNVTINATDFIQMSGLSPQTRVFNAFGTSTFFTSRQIQPITTGQAGNLNVSTRRLSMQDGSFIASTSVGDASSGKLTLNTETADLLGGANTIAGDTPTGIISASYLRGDSGTIEFNTRTLNLRNGGTISTTNLGIGRSGTISLTASESIQITSQPQSDQRLSNISSTLGSPILPQQFYNRTALVNGDAGDITIRTPLLQVIQSGIGVGNYGNGSAGTLKIQADSMQLSGTRTTISATTVAGTGGNMMIQAQNLRLLQNSKIETSAGGTGNGGNITIDAPILLGWNNSDITANAVQGRGGNIQITTQGIFGLKYRDRVTSESDITASSEFGINGSVQVNTIGVDPNSGLVELAGDLIDDNQQVAAGCASNQGSSFVITGRGGVPQNPSDRISSRRSWSDLRVLSPTTSTIATTPGSPEPLIEAASWQRNPQTGKVELIAARSAQSTTIATCSQ